jgi:mannose-6-phosphate isomerase-like protein (cupin superfamily)
MRPVRRIVTARGADGVSRIVADGPIGEAYHPGNNPKHIIQEIWRTRETPATYEMVQPELASFRLAPPAQGTAFRIIDLPPDRERDFSTLKQVFDGYHAPQALAPAPARHPAFHETATVDYAVVLEGEVWALLDEGEALMQAGDVLIQLGANHAWSNRSEANCRLLFVLIDAQPHPPRA